MDVSVSLQDDGPVQKTITIQIPRGLYSERFDRALRVTANSANIKGFRPGRAPKAMIAKLYGDKIRRDVVGELVSEAYGGAVREHALKIVGVPQFDMGEESAEDDLKVTAKVSLRPEPTIETYNGLSFQVIVEKLQDGAVEKELERLADRWATIEPVLDRQRVAEGDVATVDYQATVDGQAVKELHAADAMLEVGRSGLPQGFSAGIIGMQTGETKRFIAELPDSLKEKSFAGKQAEYQVTLKSFGARRLPELTDEFVKEKGLAEDAAALREGCAKKLEQAIEQRNRREKENKLFQAITEKNPFEVPQVMVDEEIRSVLFDMGVLDPRKEESYQFDVQAFREHLKDVAEMRVRRGVILDRIIEQEGVSVGEEELERWLEKTAADWGRPRREIEKVFDLPANQDGVKKVIAREQLVDRLLDSSQISFVEKPVEENSEN